MKPTIKNRLANIIAKLAGSPDYESGIEPKTPIEFYLNEAVDKILNGEIGSVTPAGVVTATGQMTSEQKSQTKTNLEVDPVIVSVEGDTPTVEPIDNRRYQCGTLTSLTISAPPATGEYSIVFTSGATPTTTTIPATILGLEDFAPEDNTMYEINVLDNRALVGSWVVSV